MTPRRQISPGLAWAGLGLLLLPTAMVAIDINILFLALPAITVDLRASALDQLWIADIYTLFVGALVIVAGALGDRIGRRRLLMWGCAGFLIASLLTAFAPSPAWLIVARGLQGIAGATLMPSALALIGQLFADDKQRTKAISLWATCQFGCAALGPVVGGVVLSHLWWGSVFLIAVLPCLAVLLLGRRLLPGHAAAAAAPRIDTASVLLLIGAMTSLLLASKHSATSAVRSTAEGNQW
jgi:DHA2 family multidrug resistance protein-like MFS transporter